MTFKNNLDNNIQNGGTLAQPLDRFIERAYHRYAVLTILDRALPDARDGLKPVQRRILYAMYNMGIISNHPHRKSARVVGEVLGKYHPHGDTSVYDAMVRMAQDFSMRTPLIDGQGNFGSIDGDSAAAMRYTEARLTSIGDTMLDDIEKYTVDWQVNFDGSLKEPSVLPIRFPNLIINGSSGIAVGMSTSILPHNLGEVCDAVNFICENWNHREKISSSELMHYIPGPDLPTGGIIYRYRDNGNDDQVDMIHQAYESGSAILVCQAKADIHEISGGKSEIIITELPYQVQKSTVLERIASNKEKFSGLTDVRDESDFSGMRVVFEVARGTDPQDVLERLLAHTQLRVSLSHNSLALVRPESNNGRATPRYLSMLDMLTEFIMFRIEVITRRSKFDLDKAESRIHIVLGLLKALSMIDEVIAIIRKSQTAETAKNNLMKKLSLSDLQAQAILDMPLRRLASLERKKLEDEEVSLKSRIIELKGILKSEKRRLEVISIETREIKEKYATPRRTIIIDAETGHQSTVTVADLILPTKSQLIMVTHSSIIRRDASDGRDSFNFDKPSVRAVDIPVFKINAEPSDDIILFSSNGRVWVGNTGRLPLKSVFTDIGLYKNENITGVGVVKADHYAILITKFGNIKRINIADITAGRVEASWSPIIGFSDEVDAVIYASIAPEDSQVFICTGGTDTSLPRVLRFNSSLINPQATPSAKGVTAIKTLGDIVIGGAVVEKEDVSKYFSVILTQNGFIKRLKLFDFPLQSRSGHGVLCIRSTLETSQVIGFSVGDINSSVNIFSINFKRLRLSMKNIILANRTSKGQSLLKSYGSDNQLFTNDSIAGLSVN